MFVPNYNPMGIIYWGCTYVTCAQHDATHDATHAATHDATHAAARGHNGQLTRQHRWIDLTVLIAFFVVHNALINTRRANWTKRRRSPLHILPHISITITEYNYNYDKGYGREAHLWHFFPARVST